MMGLVKNKQAKKLPIKFNKLKRQHVFIECQVWFTSTSRIMPLMFKVVDEDGELHIIKDIHIDYFEEKIYSGIASTEFFCSVVYMEQVYELKLIFFKEECKWAIAL